MTSLTPASVKLDQINLAATASDDLGLQKAPDEPARRRSATVSGLTSGNFDFDQMLNRLHVAFGELARTDDDTSSAASDAANNLSMSYTSMTGRRSPDADSSAGALALALQQGLSTMPTSLTDQAGQSLLRAL